MSRLSSANTNVSQDLCDGLGSSIRTLEESMYQHLDAR
jgi:hypothetical protein